MARRICVVTGTRAEFGLMLSALSEIANDPRLELSLVVTGMHLSPEFGLTYREIEASGIPIARRIEILLSSDSAVGVAKAMGLGVISFAEAFDSLRPEILVLVGDRFEMLAAANAALVQRIPIAHVGGGDVTEGAFDDSVRHSLTKMSHLHFVTNDVAASRVRQMGEDPRHIFNFGAPGLDVLAKTLLIDGDVLQRDLGITFRPRNLLVTFHPETLAHKSAHHQVHELLSALDKLGSDVGLYFTKANADTDGRIINQLLDEFAQVRPHAKIFSSLGLRRYLSLVRQVDAVVGNSSSGLYEVPSLGKPTVNIGNRQKGRLMATSVINCACEAEAISKAIKQAFSLDCRRVKNPYGGQGDTSKRIKEVLATVSLAELQSKPFQTL